MKKCTKCNNIKDLALFNRNSKSLDGCSSWCKDCIKTNNKENWSKTKISKNNSLQFYYGITLFEVEQMYLAQEGKCKICKTFKPTFSTSGGLYIDHCHSTGKVRGLLCNSCNILLGLVKDKAQILHDAVEYLENKSADLSTSTS